MTDKSFVVIDGDLRLLVTPGDGWYVVSSLDIRGLNTQGRTIEEAIENAHDAAKVLAEDRKEMLKEIAAAKGKMQSMKKVNHPGKSKKAKASPNGKPRKSFAKV